MPPVSLRPNGETGVDVETINERGCPKSHWAASFVFR